MGNEPVSTYRLHLENLAPSSDLASTRWGRPDPQFEPEYRALDENTDWPRDDDGVRELNFDH